MIGNKFVELSLAVADWQVNNDVDVPVIALILVPELSDYQYTLIEKSSQIYKESTLIKLFGEEEGRIRFKQTANEVVAQWGKGSGKDYKGDACNFCQGKGKVGLTPCKKCNGEKRILGKQKLSGIKLTGDETKIESMGNCSKNISGMVGYLLLKKKS